VIADLDFLAKEGELKRVLAALDAPEDAAKDLCKRARNAVKQIRQCIKQTDVGDIQHELKTLAEADFDSDGSPKLRGKLEKIIRKAYKLHELKQRGTEAIRATVTIGENGKTLRGEMEGLLSDLTDFGLFLVPVGELESWLPRLMNGVPRQDKSRWAMLAAEKIEGVDARDDDVWGFVAAVYQFLEKRLESLATATSNYPEGSSPS